MIKKLSYIYFSLIVFFDKIFIFITKMSLLIWFGDFIQERSYRSIQILNKNVSFFVPNQMTNWRVDTYFKKEPEIFEWINNFEKIENLIFWDIGANIGLYSIYNSIKNEKSTTIAFEPSTSNLRVLTRNISINNLENIKVVPIPLTNVENSFQEMKEPKFIEGGALNSFGEKFNYEGKEFKSMMQYNILGTTMNYLIKQSILEVPNYIKIDVDGIEHLILEGGNNFLMDSKIKSLFIEINENFKEQYEKVIYMTEKYNFKFLHKKHNDEMNLKNLKASNSYNYIFIR